RRLSNSALGLPFRPREASARGHPARSRGDRRRRAGLALHLTRGGTDHSRRPTRLRAIFQLMVQPIAAQRIEQIIKTYNQACNDADATAIAACFEPEAVHYFPSRPKWVGAATIANNFTKRVEEGRPPRSLARPSRRTRAGSHASGATHPSPARSTVSRDRATVFDQREHISLHVAADPSRLRKTGPLVEATAIAVVALDLDGQLFQALCREFPQSCVEQLPPDAAPLPARQHVDSRELHRFRRSAHELRESDDIATRFGDEETRSRRRERATQASREYQLSSNRRWTASGMMP